MTVWEAIQKLRTVSGAARLRIQTADGRFVDDFQIVAGSDGTINLQAVGAPEAGDELLTQQE